MSSLDAPNAPSAELRRVEQTLPHRAPFRLVDRLRSVSATEAHAVRLVTRDDLLVGDTLPAPLVLEALAQTAALMTGAGLGAHGGYLVALKDVRFEALVRVGDTLELHTRRTGSLGPLHRVTAEGRVGEVVVVRGELTFSVDPG